jgi:hypothetical protein
MAYTYTIDGKSIRTDQPLTDDELEELAGGLAGSVTTSAAGDYRVEAAKRGLTSTAGAVTGFSQAVSDYLTRAGINPFELGARAAGLPAETPPQTFTESFRRGQAAVTEPAGRMFSALGMPMTGAQPQTFGERVLATGIETVTDPLSYLFPPLAATRRMGIPGQIVARPAEQFAVGAGAETGGTAGEAVGGTPGRVVGALFGGAGGAYATGTALKTGPLAGKAYDKAADVVNKLRGVQPENELLRDVDSRINNIFIAAGAADPNFLTTLREAVKAQENVSLKAPGSPRVQMPISALMADNPVIISFIENLSSRDPVFKAKYGEQFTRAKTDLRANQIRLFGDPAKVDLATLKPEELAVITGATEKSVQRQVRSLDQQIADAYNAPVLDPNAFGARIEKLVADKEKKAIAEVRPLYTEAFNIANTKGVTLPAGSVDDIYNFVAGTQASDVFKTFPSIYNKVRARFRPTETEASPILTAEGVPATPAGVKFAEATVEDLDSLKREINKQLRRAKEPSEIRLLSELKTRVSGHIENLDPEFVAAYRNADKAYLEKVGLPFNSETLKNVDRKKFVEQIAPAIIGNKSNVDDFIRATGEEGVRVARDAFYDSFTKAALKNDVIDPKVANKWLAKNRSGMALIPGLEDELRASVNNVQQLQGKKAALEADFRRVSGEQLIREKGYSNPAELVSRMYSDRNFTNKLLNQYGGNKDILNAVRSYMLDDIVSAADPVAMLNDRNRAAVFNRVFGPTYAQKVSDFAVAAERLSKDPTQVSFRGETVPRTPIEELTGIPPEQIISRIYNPVSGPVYAVTSMFSKYWANAASKATEEKLKALLLNPSDAIKVFSIVSPKIQKFDAAKINEAMKIGKKYGIQWIQDAVNDAVTGGARGAVRGAIAEPTPAPDLEMEE